MISPCPRCGVPGPVVVSSDGALPPDLVMADEVARLRKLFDDAGQGEHNVLALIDHYQDAEIKASAEVARLREALEQVVDAADQHLHCGIADPLAFRDDCRKAIVIARAALGRTTK